MKDTTSSSNKEKLKSEKKKPLIEQVEVELDLEKCVIEPSIIYLPRILQTILKFPQESLIT